VSVIMEMCKLISEKYLQKLSGLIASEKN